MMTSCAEKQHALRRQPVTPGTARLLVIILHALGHVVVQNEPHVGFVDAHAEGVRRHNDGGFVVDEIILILRRASADRPAWYFVAAKP